MSDILFVKTSSFGDLVHQMPALSEARRHRPGDRFCWVVEESFASLVRLHPAVDEVILAPSRRWRRALHLPSTMREIGELLRTLRARQFEAIIDTQGLVRSALIARLARGRSHGMDSKNIREPIASWLYDVRHPVSRELHAVARNRMLTGLALGYSPEGQADFGLNRAALAGAVNEPYGVLLHSTSRVGKEWPTEHWIALGQALSARHLKLLVPWGSEAEHKRAKRIAASVKNAEVPAWRPLSEMVPLVAGASIVVGVDTGLMHLAAALGVPVVAVFLDTAPGLASPVGPGAIDVVGGKQVGTPAVVDVLAAVERVF